MDTKDERLDSFQNHLLDNGYSKTAAKNYRFRVSTFLKAHPEALSASKDEARAIIDDYNAKLPRNTSRTIPAAAVKRWWVFEFGEPYQPRIHPSSCTGDEAIDEECMQFRTYLDEHADIGLTTKRNRVNSIRLFLTGKALEEYVLVRRAADGVRMLFANTNSMPIASSQVQTAMSLAAGRVCIDSYHGTHGLRRMVATNMVNAGVDAKTIADVLGHERIDTTTRYMKVSLPNLMKVGDD